MNHLTVILFGIALLICWSLRSPRASKLKGLQRLSGTQKLFGIVAFLLALVILLNPEFLALGLLGDTALFDMLVLALGLQMHTHVLLAVRWLVTTLKKSARWAGIPSPGLCYTIAVVTAVAGDVVSHVQKTLQRMS